MGEIQVYDLEVDEDHSYAAGGLFNHNSSLPNLQQIPARNERFKKLLRGLFIPEEGMDWVKGDYSQIEMRVIGHYARGAGAEVLRDRYQSNPRSDFYSMVAEFAGVERQFAKMLALGVSYGMGQKKLAAQMGLRYEDAAPLFQRFHQELPFLKETSRTVSQVAANRGWVKTIMGRRRWFPDPKFSYKGLNAISQGTAADIMKKMLVDCYNDGVFDVLVPHLTVHDEVDASVPRTSEGKEALQEMKMIAESCIKLRVPLILDVETGPNWADVHEVEV